ncbi:indolepyruvate ferredoxin oxidoreductase family protein (plasmid) [Aminobacter sp. P9b]|uniref:indolepyruvate ferredoxin oxidoreductase family protein n=1 Tax=Aminobacter sp. P9b TaxID=3133697 RepID=UPI00313799C3
MTVVKSPDNSAPVVEMPSTLDERYTLERGRILVSGTQALVRLPMVQRQRDLAAGLNTAGYVSGYRGSPLAGFDREMGSARKYLKASHIVFQPGLNEDMAATAVWGTQQTGMFPGARYDGVFSMWYGKGPGVDRTMDVIRHANAVGTSQHGGVLLLVGDDHGAVSSTLPHQSEHNLISAMVPLLSPAGVGEYIDYGLLGWAMSRYSGAWVGFKCQTEIVECSATVDLDPTRLEIVTPDLPLPADGLSMRWPDAQQAMERRLETKLAAVLAFARANRLDRQVWPSPRAKLGIVSTGKSWLDLKGALSLLGIDEARAAELGIRLYKVGMVWPLEPEGLREFADGLDQVFVVEEKRPVIEEQIKSLLFNLPGDRRPQVFGKSGPDGSPLLPSIGEIGALSVARAILKWLGTEDAGLAARAAELSLVGAPSPAEPGLLNREPYFCSGCPHSTSTVVPKGSRASTGIGCHMMVIGMERDTSTFTQMGGEGGSWIGLSPFTDEKHIFVNMGDGTYFHSGLLAIRAGIAAKVNATYKILYNDAVAMTGGQRHDGELSVSSIVGQVLAEGAKQVIVVSERPHLLAGQLPRSVNVRHRDELDQVQRELREVEGVTVLVYDQVCAAEKRRRRKRGTYPVSPKRAFINELVCEGCGDCSAVSNCISIEPRETEFGRKRAINQSSCNTDLSCTKGFCPSFVTIEGGRLRKPRAKAAGGVDAALAEPNRPALGTEPYSLLLTGIGGTGVITVSAILSQAAHLDGLSLVTLDQTGLAQKNGAVVSHIRLARQPEQLNAARIGPGEADLVLGFDLVVAASQNAIATFGKGRTRTVVDDHFAPTASFVKDTTIDFREGATLRRLRNAGGEDALTTLPAMKLATALFGDAIAANMFLLGHAWQKGFVPISRGAIEKAIDLNGAGVAMNRAAFAWGRRSAEDLDFVSRQAGMLPASAAPEVKTLDEIVARRVDFLKGYQNAAYAERYRALVDKARQAETRAAPGQEAFAHAVAKAAFKLMAYKDEYEVARLHRDPAFRQKLAEQFEGGFKLQYNLAPPMLTRVDPRTGHPAKIAIGRWIEPAFAVLSRLKGLRGTRFDPFGRTAERKMERRLIADYLALVEDLIARLAPENLSAATELACLPEEVRGYGHVKLASVARFEKRKAELLAAFSQSAPMGQAA